MAKAFQPPYRDATNRDRRSHKSVLQGLGHGEASCLHSRLAAELPDAGVQITCLADRGVRCIAHDRRGHGRSSHNWRGYDYDTLADDLAAVIDQLDLREVKLVGYSMGGGEVVRYLSRHGADRITRALLLVATAPFILKTVDNPDGVEKSVFDQVRAAQVRISRSG